MHEQKIYWCYAEVSYIDFDIREKDNMQLPSNILIVEDEVITQRYLKDILAHNNIKNVECYDNAEDVLKCIKATRYEMILMDINLKGAMDGIQLAKIILDTHINIPIIFITAHCDDETFEEVLELSPYGFVSKPFSAKDVALTLQLAYRRYCVQEEMLKYKEVVKNIDTITINEQYKYSKTMMTLYCDNQPVKLKKKHILLVDTLCKMHNKTVSFEILIHKIWGDKIIADSALRTLIYSLRQILPDFPIVSYSKIGYCLKVE
ncbi:MAG TPA: response regulator transcription factor [Epsilonproteobacteria bacterium]|nr:response regulator transcription factor [Campylobacterota bacterium]